MRKILFSLISLLTAAILLGLLGIPGYRAAPGEEGEPDTREELEDALQAAVDQNTEIALIYLVHDFVIDRMEVSEDGQWAVLWVAVYDRENDEPFGMEPGLGIARLEAGKWRVFLPSDPAYFEVLSLAPTGLLPVGAEEAQIEAAQSVCDTSSIGPFSGYKLPWANGEVLRLTQSIYHTVGWGSGYNTSYSMIHAFDFATSPSALFEIRASRPGTVKYFRDVQPRGDDSSPGNYIVLEDTGTNPTSYQLYLHLDQGSIPAGLKTVGAQVQQGQPIGVADDTGFSSGHHLHFQVHTEVAWFGCSVDVLFSDVAINGGRPRMPIEAENYPEYGSVGQFYYTSQNTLPGAGGLYPTVGVSIPEMGTTYISQTVDLKGFAVDIDDGVAFTQFAVDIGSGWQGVGPVFPADLEVFEVGYFETTVDLCAIGVPDGPFKIGMIGEDEAGNITTGGLAKPVINHAGCGSAACIPAANEAAVYSLPNYLGDCTILGIGDHVQAMTASSVIVGSDVSLTLYKSASYTDRAETFFGDDTNLADNRSPSTMGSARVQLRTSSPGIPAPSWPVGGEAIPLEHSLHIYWDDGGGSDEFQVSLSSLTETLTSSWQTAHDWVPGPLATGTYSYTVRARNNGGTSAWSAPAGFSVNQVHGSSLPSPASVPWAPNFDNGTGGWQWTGSWKLLTDNTVAAQGSNAWWFGEPPDDYANATYDMGVPHAGSLTSPPVSIPGTGYYLRFFSRYETEENPNYDLRQVLISADGGPFVDIYTMDEALDAYLKTIWRASPYLDLSSFAGQTIRVRFSFTTFDEFENDYNGWLLDEVTINNSGPSTCTASTEPDNSPDTATLITYGYSGTTELCPVGDVDYYKFNGTAGDSIRVDIDAKPGGSSLDGYLYLLDSDGRSVIMEVDDEEYGVLQDPILDYVLPRTGVYYLKIRPYDHPGGGSDAYWYTLGLDKLENLDRERPIISAFTTSYPLISAELLPAIVRLEALVSDDGVGVSEVRFYYHSPNYGEDNWVLLGVDTDDSDGWSVDWDTQLYAPAEAMTLVVQAFDGAGNTSAAGLWNLFVEITDIYIPAIFRE